MRICPSRRVSDSSAASLAAPAADPGTTAADWTRQFRADSWAAVPEECRDDLAVAVERHAADRGLLSSDGWIADYCRLRFVAIAR